MLSSFCRTLRRALGRPLGRPFQPLRRSSPARSAIPGRVAARARIAAPAHSYLIQALLDELLRRRLRLEIEAGRLVIRGDGGELAPLVARHSRSLAMALRRRLR